MSHLRVKTWFYGYFRLLNSSQRTPKSDGMSVLFFPVAKPQRSDQLTSPSQHNLPFCIKNPVQAPETSLC